MTKNKLIGRTMLNIQHDKFVYLTAAGIDNQLSFIHRMETDFEGV